MSPRAEVVVLPWIAGPEKLGYANVFVGRRLAAFVSPVGDDWGQDRQRFAELVRREGLSPLYFDDGSSLRALEAELLGLDYTRLECKTELVGPAWVAMPVTTWNNDHRRCWSAIRGTAPSYVVSDHILVFRVH